MDANGHIVISLWRYFRHRLCTTELLSRIMEPATTDIRTLAIHPDGDPQPRGCVFIVSNRMTVSETSTHEDYARRMENLWKTKIGCELFEGTTHMNINGEQKDALLKRLATMETNNFDYLAVVIIGRGGLMVSKGELDDNKPRGWFERFGKLLSDRLPTNRTYSPFILGSDNKKLPEDVMLSYFYNDSSSWKDKPKLFILAYGRYSEMEIGEREAILRDELRFNVPANAAPTHIVTSWPMRKPSISDFILVHGTSSYLIGAIDDVFSNHWRTKSVTGLLTLVNHRMKSSESGFWRMSVFESSLARPFSLHPEADSSDDYEDNPDPNIAQDQDLNRTVNELLSTSEQRLRDFDIRLHTLVKEYRQSNARSHSITPRRASRGCALILSNILEPGSDYHEKDSERMTDLWRGVLGCDLHGNRSHINKSAAQMKDLIREFSSIDTSRYEYAVIAISSHGSLEKTRVRDGSTTFTFFQPYVSVPHFAGADEKLVDEREVLSFFNRDDSPWRGKVKIFILDYCRGRVTDHDVPKATPFDYEPFAQQEEVRYGIDESILPPTISTLVEDSFIVYATHARYAAFTDRLITSVKDEFMKNWRKKSVAEMLTLVNGRMKSLQRPLKSMSVFNSTVTKEFFLFQPPSMVMDEHN